MQDKISCLLVNNLTEKVVISSRLKSKIKIFLCADENEGLKVLNDAKTLFSRAFYFPPKDIFYYNADASSNDLIEQRIKAIEFISKNEEGIIITTVEAALEKLDDISNFKEMLIKLELGMKIDGTQLKKRLVLSGYHKVAKVYERGEFAQRGSIIDIFTFTHDYPIRIELFDDEIDSLRYFDIETQRGIENTEKVEIFVAKDNLGKDKKESLLEMSLSSNVALIIDEPSKMFDVLELIFSSTYELKDTFLDLDIAKSIIFGRDVIAFAQIDGGGYLDTINVTTNSKSVRNYDGNIYEMISDCKRWIKSRYRVFIYCASLLRAKRILEEFAQNDIVATIDNESDDFRVINIITASLQNSFIDEGEKIVYVSDTDVFKEIKKRRIRHEKNEYTEVIQTFSDLKIGDIVVHDNYGIGRYQGIESITVTGIKRDYLKIEYKSKSELYILATNVSSIQKYIGNESLVTLSDINSDRWKRAKERVKKQTDIIAQDIVALYADRLDRRGFSFSKDSPMQKEMEELFEFVETDDQIKAMEDIKKDMESTKIMDRLLCGDVGFGKTELAIRAAFKAVLDNKQVAILVPTTILASQHFEVFRKRLEKFPVNIAMLSRFITPKNQKIIIENINKGMIDIVIGTQSILKKDIVFKNLGLLIVDEEQRFGVKDKERIKKFKTDIDTLALSATPIPRTLNMSLSGIRDLSLLMQPPFDRQPIQVYVLEYKLDLVKEAILRESKRGGQIYFLHNNIYDIQEVAQEIRDSVPNLRVAVVHSRLSKNEIESVFNQFNEGMIDILVSTTIVETGLDIPNVNTIIINNADKFGLSTLYQLKGRVGRSNKKAYAYFMYKKGKNLTEKSIERLKAIREFNRLGSGIKIAMKDMEIRGSGSLLGNVQHGHIESIGYDMYCKILRESISQAKGEDIRNNFYETIIDINVDTHIDDSYIQTEMEKLEMYKKFNTIYTIEDMYDVIDECNDRFGDIPKEVLNIIKLGYVKNVANSIGVIKIFDTKTINIKFGNDVKIDTQKFVEYLGENAQRMKFVGGLDNTLYVEYKNLIKDLVEVVTDLKKIEKVYNDI